MAFSRPTLRRLINRAQTDIESVLQNGASRVRRSVEYVMAYAMAGLSHGQHGHITEVSRNIVPDRSKDDFLIRYAAWWGLERTPATTAQFTITVTGDAGTAIPQGTEWSRTDGALFESIAAEAIPAAPPDPGTATVTVRATSTESDPNNGSGADGNTEGGAILTLTNPVSGLEADATVDGTEGELQGGGADIESIDALRQRLRDRVQTPPSGGGPGDYVDEAKTVSGVTRAWELPLHNGPGTVLVLFVQDIIDADDNFVDTVFPDAAKIADVQEVLDAFAPVTAQVTADAPENVDLDPTIQLEPNDTTTQAQVTAALQDLLLRRAEPGGTLLLSEINEAISLAQNEDDHILVSPVANVTVDATELLTLGTITFQSIP